MEGPGARPGGPRSHKTHGARCVPGTSQASAEAENDEVAIFPAPVGNCHFVGVGGAQRRPRATFFPAGGGVLLGQLVLCESVCLSVTLADRKIQHFREIRRLLLAEQKLTRAQNAPSKMRSWHIPGKCGG